MRNNEAESLSRSIAQARGLILHFEKMELSQQRWTMYIGRQRCTRLLIILIPDLKERSRNCLLSFYVKLDGSGGASRPPPHVYHSQRCEICLQLCSFIVRKLQSPCLMNTKFTRHCCSLPCILSSKHCALFTWFSLELTLLLLFWTIFSRTMSFVFHVSREWKINIA